jgi:putative phosphoesterase
MKVLVLSDSHASLRFMRKCVETLKPDAIVHLGDYYDDAEALTELFPHIRMHQVAGNCDKYRAPIHARTMLCYNLGGVMTFMTHGHQQQVKSGIGGLLSEARRYDAKVVLYGHTHVADCHQEEDGLWVLNPGACGSSGGSVGLIETENGAIRSCKILHQADLEELL